MQEASAIVEKAADAKTKVVQLLHEKKCTTQVLNRLGECNEKYSAEYLEMYKMLLDSAPQARTLKFHLIRMQYESDHP